MTAASADKVLRAVGTRAPLDSYLQCTYCLGHAVNRIISMVLETCTDGEVCVL